MKLVHGEFNAGIAQLVERQSEELSVDSSILSPGTIYHAPLVHADRTKKGDMRFAESVRLEWVDIW